MGAEGTGSSRVEKALLNDFQKDFPLVSQPYAQLAESLCVNEDAVIETLGTLLDRGLVSRVGAVVAPHTAGSSTLAAMAVPEKRLEEVAAIVSKHPEVNHNYEREHRFNLWFVVTGADEASVRRVLDDVGRRTGLTVLDLPLLEEFHIDLGFPLWQG